MPSKTEKQARFMKAVAHGWKPRHAKAPPVGVAKEFVAADQAAGMYEGGLAPMNDVTQRGFAPGLTGMAPGFQDGGGVEVLEDYGGLTQEQQNLLNWDVSKGGSWIAKAIRKMQDNLRAQHGISAPPVMEATMVEAPEPMMQGPRGGPRGRRGRGGGRGGGGGGIGADDTGGPGGGGPTGGGGPLTVPPLPDGTCPPGYRMGIRGNCRPGTPGDDGRIIPPNTPPIDYTPPDPRAGRDTEYADAIMQHKLRVAAALQVPPGGYAEGGEARAGHAEGPNPYDEGTASYKYWERRNHEDPPPPPPPPPPPEERSWLDIIMGKKEDSQTRTERELEELEKNEAHGGYIRGYANGGLAHLFSGPPRGGVPPKMGASDMLTRRGGVPPSMKPQMDPRSMPPQPYGGGSPLEQATTGQGSLPPHLRNRPPGMRTPMQPIGMKDPRQRIAPPPGKDPRFGGRDPRAMPPRGGRGGRRPPINPRGIPVPRGMPPGRGGPGPEGGPQMPPNMRGMLQKMKMQNRPRRGFSGPAGAGGPPNNRVGQSDQQGGLARALQRGTGRPPMSRRSGSFQ